MRCEIGFILVSESDSCEFFMNFHGIWIEEGLTWGNPSDAPTEDIRSFLRVLRIYLGLVWFLLEEDLRIFISLVRFEFLGR